MTVTFTALEAGTVGEAMNPGVLTCLPVTPLRSVARMMARHHVHAIVVFGSDDRLRPWGVISDLDLVAAINGVLGTSLAPVFEPARAGDVRDSQASMERARSVLGYEPVVGFEEGLRRTLQAAAPLV